MDKHRCIWASYQGKFSPFFPPIYLSILFFIYSNALLLHCLYPIFRATEMETFEKK